MEYFQTAQTIISTALDVTLDAQSDSAIRKESKEAVLEAGARLERVALQDMAFPWRCGCTPFLDACALAKPPSPCRPGWTLGAGCTPATREASLGRICSS